VAAIQSANHELGTVQPIADLDLPIPLFVDACASMGRLSLPAGWDAVAGSAHKWGGPGGVGVLLVRARSPWESPFPGDDRVDERATGFENVPAILAAAAALQAVVAERDAANARAHRQIDRLRAAITSMDGATVLGDPTDRLPHLVTVAFDRVDGEALIDGLAGAGIGAASGSACGASAVEPSRIVAALGALDAATHGNLRISVTRETDDAQIEDLVEVLPRVVANLRGGLPG
jgi:cysteine desulfurase